MDALRTEIEAGMNHLANGQWTQAVRHLTAAVRRDPGKLSVVRALATAYLQLNNPLAARQTLADFTLRYPLSAEGWRLAALLEWRIGIRAEALRVIARGLERLPQSALLHRQIAVFFGALGDLDAADRYAASAGDESLTACLAAARGGPDAAPSLIEPATSPSDTSEPDCLNRVAQDPAVLDGVLRVANQRDDRPMLGDLADRVARLIDDQPGHADRHVALGRLRLRVGDAVGARVSAERALAVNPYYADARRLRDEACSAAGAAPRTGLRHAA